MENIIIFIIFTDSLLKNVNTIKNIVFVTHYHV